METSIIQHTSARRNRSNQNTKGYGSDEEFIKKLYSETGEHDYPVELLDEHYESFSEIPAEYASIALRNSQ